tara:strand:+ start:3260 stop:4027 length:768 start_codon:yes stop_codon:yes gene_type:complete
MVLTDTHTHLYLEHFKKDIDLVIERAISSNISRFFLPAISSKYTKSMIDLRKKYPDNIFLMSGLHPCYVENNYLDELSHIEKNLLEDKNIVAIGEIGIDLYWDESNLDLQKKAFERQIELSNNFNLPIIIHCRESFNEIYRILKQKPVRNGGIFHCFTGSLDEANKIIDMGMKIGIGGVVTFKNGKIDKFLEKIDIKNIVLETDSPYLSPIPLRGKRNESMNITIIAEKLANIYGLNLNEIAEITTANSRDVFRL